MITLTGSLLTLESNKLGCVLYPALFDMFINDLMKDIQDLNKGIDLGDYKLAALLYADDVAVLGETECDLQCILDTTCCSMV